MGSPDVQTAGYLYRETLANIHYYLSPQGHHFQPSFSVFISGEPGVEIDAAADKFSYPIGGYQEPVARVRWPAVRCSSDGCSPGDPHPSPGHGYEYGYLWRTIAWPDMPVTPLYFTNLPFKTLPIKL